MSPTSRLVACAVASAAALLVAHPAHAQKTPRVEAVALQHNPGPQPALGLHMGAQRLGATHTRHTDIQGAQCVVVSIGARAPSKRGPMASAAAFAPLTRAFAQAALCETDRPAAFAKARLKEGWTHAAYAPREGWVYAVQTQPGASKLAQRLLDAITTPHTAQPAWRKLSPEARRAAERLTQRGWAILDVHHHTDTPQQGARRTLFWVTRGLFGAELPAGSFSITRYARPQSPDTQALHAAYIEETSRGAGGGARFATDARLSLEWSADCHSDYAGVADALEEVAVALLP